MRRRDLLLLAAGDGDDPEPGLGRDQPSAHRLCPGGVAAGQPGPPRRIPRKSRRARLDRRQQHRGSRSLGRGARRAVARHRQGADRLRRRDPGHRRDAGHARREARDRDDPDRPGRRRRSRRPRRRREPGAAPRQRHGPVLVFVRGDRERGCSCCRSSFPGCAGLRSSSGEIPASSKSCRTSAPMPRR